MLSLLEHMYHELDLVREFNMNPITLRRWLVILKKSCGMNFDKNFVIISAMYTSKL